MSTTLSLRCACGAVRGRVLDYAPARANRVTCYCTDCRAFVERLGREDLLDAHGGSDIVQVAPASVAYHEGREHLRCGRLTERGLFRWYAACCKQPLGNTVGATWSPFVGLVTGLVARPAGESLDALLGPSVGGVHGRRAIGGRPADADEVLSARKLVRGLVPMLGHVFRGRTKPYPFVGDDVRPLSEPHLLPG